MVTSFSTHFLAQCLLNLLSPSPTEFDSKYSPNIKPHISLTHQSDRHPQLGCVMRVCICCVCSLFALHRLVEAVKQRPDYGRTRERDTDLITESNKRSRLSLQMFSLDMMTPSITPPPPHTHTLPTHVRGSEMSVTQLKSRCRGGVFLTVTRFRSATRAVLSQPSPPPLSCVHLQISLVR